MRRASENEESESDEREVESLTKRPFVAQEVGINSVSTFCQNEIKDRNYKSFQQHIFLSFSFSGKHGCLPPSYAEYHFCYKSSTSPPKS